MLARTLRESFRRSAALYDELARDLPEEALALKLPAIRSNTLGGQLWCVVGARESYLRAIERGAWSGFACSLDAAGALRLDAVQSALSRSGAAMLEMSERLDDLDPARQRLAVDLLEHEAAHQGQLIRYLYALDLKIPASWKKRYALA